MSATTAPSHQPAQMAVKPDPAVLAEVKQGHRLRPSQTNVHTLPLTAEEMAVDKAEVAREKAQEEIQKGSHQLRHSETAVHVRKPTAEDIAVDKAVDAREKAQGAIVKGEAAAHLRGPTPTAVHIHRVSKEEFLEERQEQARKDDIDAALEDAMKASFGAAAAAGKPAPALGLQQPSQNGTTAPKSVPHVVASAGKPAPAAGDKAKKQ